MILEKNLLISLPLLTIDNRLHSAISATLGIVQWMSGIVEFKVRVALHFSLVPPDLSPSVDILSLLSNGCCLSWVLIGSDQGPIIEVCVRGLGWAGLARAMKAAQ